MIPIANYVRKARIVHFVDGDTVDAEIDFGFRVSQTHRLRLLRVNTPELRSSDPEIRILASKANYSL